MTPTGEKLDMDVTPQRVLIVDDEPAVCSVLCDVLSEEGRRRCTSCLTAAEACAALDREPYDVVVTDVRMPGMSGMQLLERIVERSSPPQVIVISGALTLDSARRALKHGAFGYIQKPFDPIELRRAVDEAANARLACPPPPPDPADGRAGSTPNASPAPPTVPDTPTGPVAAGLSPDYPPASLQLKRASLESVRALAAAVEAKDPYTKKHSLAVSTYCEVIAARLGMSPNEIETLKNAAILHDIGKIGIPDAILQKPGPLTPAEFTIVKTHPELAVQILGHLSFLSRELPIILHHHERLDGTGYPAGLVGEQIPLAARILSVADAMETMLTARSYKPRRTVAEVQAELRAWAGRQFDPRVVDAAVEFLERSAADFSEAALAAESPPPPPESATRCLLGRRHTLAERAPKWSNSV